MPGYLNDLGNRLRDRYLWTEELSDLERAIQTYEQALESAPSVDGVQRGLILSNLSTALLNRYMRLGTLSDLERAIASAREAVASEALNTDEAAGRLSNLSYALSERYRRTADASDGAAAIEAARQAVALAPAGSFGRLSALLNLGAALLMGAGGTRERADIDEAVHAFEEVIADMPSSRPERAQALLDLGIALRYRYQLDPTDPADRDRALAVLQEAIAEATDGSPTLAASLHAIGTALWERYNELGLAADLASAGHALERAVARTPDDSADLPRYLNAQAIVLSEQFYLSPTEDLAELEPAVEALERAWSNLSDTFAGSPVAYKLGQQRSAAELGIAERLVAFQLQRAALDTAQADEALRRAMVVAEGEKSRVLSELVARGDLPAPSVAAAELVARERELLADLAAAEAAELAGYGHAMAGGDAAARLERRRAGKAELDAVWDAIARAGPEGADYVALRRGEPPEWEDLRQLAGELGPATAVVSMFSTNSRTVLLILRGAASTPAVVEVALSTEGWEDLRRRLDREMRVARGRRGETWPLSVRPLFESAAAHLEGVERVVLAPQSHSLQVPWAVVAHRAGWHALDGGPVALTTLPALGILPRLRGRPTATGGPVVVIGDPVGDLPFAQREAEEVAELLGTTPLLADGATRAALVEQLAEAQVVHLATHAQFDPSSPLDSGVVLADGVVTARDVLRMRLRAELLVLSACETGSAGALGGELAGLAQAFLQAGARSLVVSLWKVDDAATATLMSAFHERRQTADTATALADAMEQVRAAVGSDDAYSWGPFVHMGDWRGGGECRTLAAEEGRPHVATSP